MHRTTKKENLKSSQIRFKVSSHVAASSLALLSSASPPGNLVLTHSSTMWLAVCDSPHSHCGDWRSPHRWRRLREGTASARKRFSSVHWPRGSSIPGRRWFGLSTRCLLGTSAAFQRADHTSAGENCWSGGLCQIGRLDGSLCRGWFCRSVFSGRFGMFSVACSSRSVAASLLRSGGTMLHKTGSHSVRVHLIAPEMTRMLEFS